MSSNYRQLAADSMRAARECQHLIPVFERQLADGFPETPRMLEMARRTLRLCVADAREWRRKAWRCDKSADQSRYSETDNKNPPGTVS